MLSIKVCSTSPNGGRAMKNAQQIKDKAFNAAIFVVLGAFSLPILGSTVALLIMAAQREKFPLW